MQNSPFCFGFQQFSNQTNPPFLPCLKRRCWTLRRGNGPVLPYSSHRSAGARQAAEVSCASRCRRFDPPKAAALAGGDRVRGMEPPRINQGGGPRWELVHLSGPETSLIQRIARLASAHIKEMSQLIQEMSGNYHGEHKSMSRLRIIDYTVDSSSSALPAWLFQGAQLSLWVFT